MAGRVMKINPDMALQNGNHNLIPFLWYPPEITLQNKMKLLNKCWIPSFLQQNSLSPNNKIDYLMMENFLQSTFFYNNEFKVMNGTLQFIMLVMVFWPDF